MLKFKNDKERIAFLEDYRNEDNGWYLWKEDSDLQRRWWRYDLPDRALIVEEQTRTYHWPDTRIEWSIVHWFVITDWTGEIPFGDQVGSRSMALVALKEVEKKYAGRKENTEL